MGELLELRRELSYVAAYLLTCKESVAEELKHSGATHPRVRGATA